MSEPPTATNNTLFTVGHSNLEFVQFVKLLAGCQVQLLADVRSRPYSSRFPHFSQPAFEAMLEREGTAYLFLGEELGGRPDDPDAYQPDGVVDYQARRKSYGFRSGLDRLLAEAGRRKVAVMCAEEDPIECHRFLMICPELTRARQQPVHVRKDHRLESQEMAENRLLRLHGFEGVAAHTLFPEMREDALEQSYKLQAAKAAFRVSPELLIDRW
ncbi:MAG: DUF488 family protein [Terriglobia bacterium]